MAKKSSRSAQKAQVTAAQQRLAELRKEQARKESRNRLLLGGVMGVVLLLVIGVVIVVVATHKTKKDVVQATPDTVADTSGIEGVKAWKYESPGSSTTGTPGAIQATHVGNQSVQYFTYPPVGGPHNPVWLNCGEYTSTPHWENAVHDMEHGAIIITYRPDLPKDQVTALETLLKGEPTVTITQAATSSAAAQSADTKLRYMDLWPYSGQKSPIMLSSWGHQLDVDTASDARIQKYIDAFRVVSGVSPEYGASCAGGTGSPVKGTT